jgi:hypothetical protein
LHAAGAPYDQYPGHTELLQAEAARHTGVPLAQMPVRMMLANDELRTVLVSIHVSLREALDAITVDRVLETLHITHTALTALLGRKPRIAVAGVNPHAGEGGLFGREEIEVLQPALTQARQEGLNVHGPYAPDTVFMRARQKPGVQREFDVVVAMYHDQGLIPVKYLGVEQGVNVTLGLPLIVHEQNRAPGLTNRVLARFARKVLTGFPGAFPPPAEAVGNPVREAIAALPDHDVRDRLGAIAAPTLVVVGELDEETPPAYSEALAVGIPGARLEVIPGVGHLTPFEAPAALSRLLRDHVDMVEAA